MAMEDTQEKPSQQPADGDKTVAVNGEPQEEGQEAQVDPGESSVPLAAIKLGCVALPGLRLTNILACPHPLTIPYRPPSL